MERKLKAICFGEVLWDNFPSGKKIGGAPLNVALRLHSLGLTASIISKVGEDEDGRNIINYITRSGIEPLIQVDPILDTGMVNVSVDDLGNASYDIEYPSAWDNILYDRSLSKVVKESDVFIYGSLVCRGGNSSETLFRLLDNAGFKVLDVNLRKPHYSLEKLLQLMNKADFIKLNENELNEVCAEFGFIKESITKKLKLLSAKTGTEHLCVTRGAQGVILYYNGKYFHNSGFNVKVKDTVGAGDSFLAGYLSELLNGQTPANALDFACAVGSIVATKVGANSRITGEEVKRLLWLD